MLWRLMIGNWISYFERDVDVEGDVESEGEGNGEGQCDVGSSC